MMNWYLVPQLDIFDEFGARVAIGPKYFNSRFTDGFNALGFYNYGFMGTFLVLADLAAPDHAALVANVDVYGLPAMTPPAFPELDASIAAGDRGTISTVFENAKIPTPWLTPASTWRDLIRRSGQMFRFMNRYKVVSTTVPVQAGNGVPTVTATQIQAPGFDFTPYGVIGTSVFRCVLDGLHQGSPLQTFGYIAESENGAANVYQDKGQTLPGWQSELSRFDSFTGFSIGLANADDLFNGVDLTDQFRNWPAHKQASFLATVQQYGLPAELIGQNSTIRQMLGQVSDEFAGIPFSVGSTGFTF